MKKQLLLFLLSNLCVLLQAQHHLYFSAAGSITSAHYNNSISITPVPILGFETDLDYQYQIKDKYQIGIGFKAATLGLKGKVDGIAVGGEKYIVMGPTPKINIRLNQKLWCGLGLPITKTTDFVWFFDDATSTWIDPPAFIKFINIWEMGPQPEILFASTENLAFFSRFYYGLFVVSKSSNIRPISKKYSLSFGMRHRIF